MAFAGNPPGGMFERPDTWPRKKGRIGSYTTISYATSLHILHYFHGEHDVLKQFNVPPFKQTQIPVCNPGLSGYLGLQFHSISW